MTEESLRRLAHDRARAKRLAEFAKAEVTDMIVHARFEFVEQLLEIFKPEIDEIARQARTIER